ISLSFMSPTGPGGIVHLDQVGDLPDHAADRRGILQLPRAVHLVEAEADQRLALARLAADRRPGLGHLHGLLRRAGRRALVLLRHWLLPPPRRPRPAPGPCGGQAGPTPSCRAAPRPPGGWSNGSAPRRSP